MATGDKLVNLDVLKNTVQKEVVDLKSASITSFGIDLQPGNYNQYFTDANDAPLNKIVYITNIITSAMVSHLPVYGVAGTLITLSYLATAVNTKCQIYITAENSVYTRVKAVGVWTNWEKFGKAIQSSNIEMNTDNYNQYFTDANDAPLNNIVYFNYQLTSAMVSHLPVYGVAGLLITFSYLSSAVNTKCQIYITAENVVYTRVKAFGVWTDWKTFGIQDNKALSSDVVDIVESSMLQVTDDNDFTYDGHTFIDPSGQPTTGDYPIALSDYIPASYGKSYRIKIISTLSQSYGPRNLRIHAYDADKVWIKQLKAFNFQIASENETFEFSVDRDTIKYIRVSVPVVINVATPPDNTITKVTLYTDNQIFIAGASDFLRYGLHTVPPSEGAFNAIRRARQLTDAKWTPKANLPRTMLNTGDTYLDSHGESYDGQFTANQQYEGMPYSYTYGTPRYIGINEPIDLYYSCLTNTNSALYANSAFSGNSATYYGTTCSTIVGYALNLPNIDSGYYSGIKGMTHLYDLITNGVRHSIDDMQIGDVLVQTTHVAMIGDIIKNGINVTDIEILEGTRQGCTDKTVLNSELGGVARRFWMTVDEFFTWFDGFALYRYAYIDSVKFTRNPFVPLNYGEKSMPTRYFPCMPFYGNRAVFKSNSNGNTIKILIHDTNYTHLLVYKDGVQYGSYEITGLSSVDVSCEYGEAEYSANLVTYNNNQIASKSVFCYWYMMPDYDFTVTDDDTNHNISVTVRKGNFKPWYATFYSSATENNPYGFTLVNSNYQESTSGDNITYTFAVKKSSLDSTTCILALQSDKYAYFCLQKTLS